MHIIISVWNLVPKTATWQNLSVWSCGDRRFNNTLWHVLYCMYSQISIDVIHQSTVLCTIVTVCIFPLPSSLCFEMPLPQCGATRLQSSCALFLLYVQFLRIEVKDYFMLWLRALFCIVIIVHRKFCLCCLLSSSSQLPQLNLLL